MDSEFISEKKNDRQHKHWLLAKSAGGKHCMQKIKATKKDAIKCTHQNWPKACQLPHMEDEHASCKKKKIPIKDENGAGIYKSMLNNLIPWMILNE